MSLPRDPSSIDNAYRTARRSNPGICPSCGADVAEGWACPECGHDPAEAVLAESGPDAQYEASLHDQSEAGTSREQLVAYAAAAFDGIPDVAEDVAGVLDVTPTAREDVGGVSIRVSLASLGMLAERVLNDRAEIETLRHALRGCAESKAAMLDKHNARFLELHAQLEAARRRP